MVPIESIKDPDAYRLFVQRVEGARRRGLPLATRPGPEEPEEPQPQPRPTAPVDVVATLRDALTEKTTPAKARKSYVASTPERSREQRMVALVHANEIRTARAELKRDLKAGRESIIHVLAEPPAFVATAKVVDLMLAVPKYGRVKAGKVLQSCRISPSKTIGGLSVRQRTELVSMIRR